MMTNIIGTLYLSMSILTNSLCYTVDSFFMILLMNITNTFLDEKISKVKLLKTIKVICLICLILIFILYLKIYFM